VIGLAPLQVGPTAIASSVNAVWVLVASFLIFFMQAGFALLEAGQVRSKNVANVLMKNMMDWSIGILGYFLVGFGVAGAAAILTSASGGPALSTAFAYINDANTWIGWLFGAVFAATCATIVSGAVAERIKFKAYLIYSLLISVFMYPVIQGFAWGNNGLLTAGGLFGAALGVGYFDFAGATVVHMLGGTAGLVAAWMLGPRRGRYDKDGNSIPIPGHSITFAFLGTFILAFGWYGFNVGTQATVLSATSGSFMGAALGRVALNTTLAMGAGACAAMIMTWYMDGKPDPLFAANGLLAGLVAITGACAHVTWWGGIVIGLIGGGQAPLVYRFVVERLKIDDVAGVFPVHGSAGAIGTWLIPFFAVGGFSMAQLEMQTVGILTILVWGIVVTFLIFTLAKYTVGLKVTREEELEGLDLGEHGIQAYPEFVNEGRSDIPGATPGLSADGGVRTDGGHPVADDPTANGGSRDE